MWKEKRSVLPVKKEKGLDYFDALDIKCLLEKKQEYSGQLEWKTTTPVDLW